MKKVFNFFEKYFRIIICIIIFAVIISCAIGGAIWLGMILYYESWSSALGFIGGVLGLIVGTLAGCISAAVTCGPILLLFSIRNSLDIIQKEIEGSPEKSSNSSGSNKTKSQSSNESQTQEAPEGWVCPSCGTLNPLSTNRCQNCDIHKSFYSK